MGEVGIAHTSSFWARSPRGTLRTLTLDCPAPGDPWRLARAGAAAEPGWGRARGPTPELLPRSADPCWDVAEC